MIMVNNAITVRQFMVTDMTASGCEAFILEFRDLLKRDNDAKLRNQVYTQSLLTIDIKRAAKVISNRAVSHCLKVFMSRCIDCIDN